MHVKHSQKVLQLALTLPTGYYLRSLVDEKLAIFCDFDLEVTYGEEAASHTVYLPTGIWIGHIFRDFQDEHWQIAATGELNVRGAWPDFWVAVSKLIEWRDQINLQKAKELKEWRSWKQQEDPKLEKKKRKPKSQ